MCSMEQDKHIRNTISLTLEVRNRLADLKMTKRETYDHVIRRLLNHTAQQLETEKEDFHKSLEVK